MFLHARAAGEFTHAASIYQWQIKPAHPLPLLSSLWAKARSLSRGACHKSAVERHEQKHHRPLCAVVEAQREAGHG